VLKNYWVNLAPPLNPPSEASYQGEFDRFLSHLGTLFEYAALSQGGDRTFQQHLSAPCRWQSGKSIFPQIIGMC